MPEDLAVGLDQLYRFSPRERAVVLSCRFRAGTPVHCWPLGRQGPRVEGTLCHRFEVHHAGLPRHQCRRRRGAIMKATLNIDGREIHLSAGNEDWLLGMLLQVLGLLQAHGLEEGLERVAGALEGVAKQYPGLKVTIAPEDSPSLESDNAGKKEDQTAP